MSEKTPEQRERAFELLDFLKNHPDSHDQNFFASPAFGKRMSSFEPLTAARALNECGTVACAAGWAVLLAGGRIARPSLAVIPRIGLTGEVPVLAAELLGLDDDEAYRLFFDAQDLDDVADAIWDIYGTPEATR